MILPALNKKLGLIATIMAFLALPATVWASLVVRPKTEPFDLTAIDREYIASALDKLRSGLSAEIDVITLSAERVISNKPGFTYFPFLYTGYRHKASNEDYDQYIEIHCKQKTAAVASWECGYSGQAVVYSANNTEQTIWYRNDIEYENAVKIVEFLRTKPLINCTYDGPYGCGETFDEEKLKEIKGISLSYSNKNAYQIGDHRNTPGNYYEIEPINCDTGSCQLKITNTGFIMY